MGQKILKGIQQLVVTKGFSSERRNTKGLFALTTLQERFIKAALTSRDKKKQEAYL
jgi:hypothetical protein